MSRRPCLLALVLLAPLAGCDPAPPVASCSSNDDCGAGEVCRDTRCVAVPAVDGGDGMDAGPGRLDAGPPAALESIALDPATATLVSVDGSTPEQTFAVVGTYTDGSTRPVAGPTFAIDPVSLGDVDVASGRFVANGVIGGTATVTATVTGPMGAPLEATATLTVRIERTLIGDGVPADAASRFATPASDDTRRAELVYPLDGAVMPQNVYPADLQWLRGVSGDLFRVTMQKPSITVTAYLMHDGALQNHWLADTTAWRSLAQTDPDADASLTVDRWEAASGEAIAGTPVSVRFARAALTGSVYYWDIQRGRIVRIDDGTATATDFMPNPPAAIDGVTRCVGCHTVSNSGRYMAGRLGGGENIGAVFDLTTDLTGDPPPTVFPLQRTDPTSIRWWFSSWSPDDTRMVVSQDDSVTQQMAIYDPFLGTQVGVAGTLPSDATHPAWSPDGTQIAYISGTDTWGGANTTGNVSVLEVLGPDTFGGTSLLHDGTTLAGDTPGGNADSYPTWSPDSALIAFGHGTGSRSEDQQGALYAMNRDGTDVRRLASASPGVADFQPRFSPFEQGGYYWMSFLSRRDYGNAEVGTRGLGYQQIWVTAIRVGAAPGEDPSSVPYWVAGQSTGSRNISAYWAPRPCRPDGESCSVGSECCGGDCRPDASGALVCSPPPPDRCRMADETCSTDADCCEGLTCLGNVCVRAPE